MLHRLAALVRTAKRTGELWCVTPDPERSVPLNTPVATTPAAVAWKLVILAVRTSLDGRGAALAAGAPAAAKAATDRTAMTSLRIVSPFGGREWRLPGRPAVVVPARGDLRAGSHSCGHPSC